MDSKTTCTKEITISKKELGQKLGIEGKIEYIYTLTDSWGVGVTGIIIKTIVSEAEEKE